MNLENSSSSVIDMDEVIRVNKSKWVKRHLDAYLENPNLSLRSFETKSGVPYSTLRRITQLEGCPQPEAVVKIFLTLGLDQDLVRYMEEFHPEIASIMATKNTHNHEYKYVEEDHRQFFTDEKFYLILSLAYTTAGTTDKEIQTQLGEVGLSALNTLLNKGIVNRLESGRIVGKVSDFKLPFSDIKKRISYALDHYRLDEAGNINNWLSYQTESLNDDGLKALKLLQQNQFNERKEKIFSNPLYLGNIKVYSAAVSSTFLAYKESEV